MLQTEPYSGGVSKSLLTSWSDFLVRQSESDGVNEFQVPCGQFAQPLLVQGLVMEAGEEGLTPEQRRTLKAIRERKGDIVADHRSKKAVANNQAVLPRRADRERKSNTANLKVRLFANVCSSLSNNDAPKACILTCAHTHVESALHWHHTQMQVGSLLKAAAF